MVEDWTILTLYPSIKVKFSFLEYSNSLFQSTHVVYSTKHQINSAKSVSAVEFLFGFPIVSKINFERILAGFVVHALSHIA